MKNLLRDHVEELKTFTTAAQVIKWAVKNEVNKKISLADFKIQLQEIGIEYKKLKRSSIQSQMYNEDLGEARVRGLSKKLSKQLFNISKNLGVSISSILKPKIKEIVDSYPDHIKQVSID